MIILIIAGNISGLTIVERSTNAQVLSTQTTRCRLRKSAFPMKPFSRQNTVSPSGVEISCKL